MFSRLGKAWVIPENAMKPTDGRVTSGEYVEWHKQHGKDEKDIFV